MLRHEAHQENARRALAEYDRARDGAEVSSWAVKVAGALRVLLYEPSDGHQGDFVPCRQRCCAPAPATTEVER